MARNSIMGTNLGNLALFGGGVGLPGERDPGRRGHDPLHLRHQDRQVVGRQTLGLAMGHGVRDRGQDGDLRRRLLADGVVGMYTAP